MKRSRTDPSRTTIMDIPPEIMHNILLPVSSRNFEWHREVKAVCRSWRNITRSDVYLKEVDLFDMSCLRRDHHGFFQFKNLCLQKGNPSGLYILGLGVLFRRGNREEGMRLLREAAAGGYDLAIYAVACIEKMENPSDNYDGMPSHDFVLNCRQKLHWDRTRIQRYVLPTWFVELTKNIAIHRVRDCDCAPYRGAYRWGIWRKCQKACDRCFWKEEMWFFATKLTKQVVDWDWPFAG